MNKIMNDHLVLLRAMKKALKDPNMVYYKKYSSAIQPMFGIIDEIIADEEKNWISLSETKDNITYCRKEADKLSATRRVETTLVKFILRGLSRKDADYILHFCEKYASLVWKEIYLEGKVRVLSVRILSGEEIMAHYRNQTHNKACMSGSSAWKTGLYAVNPDKVQLVEMGTMRALLWTTDKGIRVLDRIYPIFDPKIELFQIWAKKNRIKRFTTRINHTVTLKKYQNDKRSGFLEDIYPYMDNMKYAIDMGDSIEASSHIPKKVSGYLFLSGTEGTALRV
jgi:hypothetical protein